MPIEVITLLLGLVHPHQLPQAGIEDQVDLAQFRVHHQVQILEARVVAPLEDQVVELRGVVVQVVVQEAVQVAVVETDPVNFINTLFFK